MLTTYYSKGILLRFDTLEDMRAVVNSSMTTIKANKKVEALARCLRI